MSLLATASINGQPIYLSGILIVQAKEEPVIALKVGSAQGFLVRLRFESDGSSEKIINVVPEQSGSGVTVSFVNFTDSMTTTMSPLVIGEYLGKKLLLAAGVITIGDISEKFSRIVNYMFHAGE